MIIPINNGKTIIPVYIPQPTVSHSTAQVSTQVSNEEIQPKEMTGTDIFFIIFIFLLVISALIYYIYLLNELTKGK